MHEPLLERINVLERAVQRWKLISLTLLILLVCGTAISGTFGLVLLFGERGFSNVERARMEADMARENADMARQEQLELEAKMARADAERARQELAVARQQAEAARQEAILAHHLRAEQALKKVEAKQPDGNP